MESLRRRITLPLMDGYLLGTGLIGFVVLFATAKKTRESADWMAFAERNYVPPDCIAGTHPRVPRNDVLHRQYARLDRALVAGSGTSSARQYRV